MNAAKPYQPAPQFGLVFGGMMLLQVFTTMDINSPAVLGPVVLKDFGLAPSLLGMFVAIMTAGSMFASLLAGTTVRRFGAVRAAQIGGLTMAAALAVAATGHAELVVIASIFFGLGLGPITPASSELLARVTPFHRMGLVFSIRQAGMPVGIGIMGIMLPALLLVTSWNGAMLIMAAAIAVICVGLQPLREAIDGDRDPSVRLRAAGLWQPVATLWRDPTLRGLALCLMFYGGIQNTMLVYAVSYRNIELHYSLAAAGALFAVIQVSAVMCRILWGWLADRLADVVLVMGLLGLASAAFLLAFSAIGPHWPAAVVTLLFGVGGATLSGWNGLHFAIIAQKVPRNAVGTVTGATQVFGFLGALTGPFVFALLIPVMGSYAGGFLVFSALMLPAPLWLLFRLRKRPAVAS